MFDSRSAPLDASAVERAAFLIEQADALIVAAGAGMGVDSGLPDFRGKDGFWRAYPALREAQIDFYNIASPSAFHSSPERAWGFYGHRLALYRETVPHQGYDLLRRWGDRKLHGLSVFTSNVDGQFQKAGFDHAHIHECHGSIHHLQCLEPCLQEVWVADDFQPEVDEQKCQLRNSPPVCPHCGGLARPNVLMFGDWGWIDRRSATQGYRQDAWLSGVTRPIVIELGAGTTIPSVRHFSQRVIHQLGGRLVRINPNECDVPTRRDVGLRMGAADGLVSIAKILGDGWGSPAAGGGDDRFSLSRFGSTVEHRARGLWKATETTKLAAQRWVGALKADLGGTEMEAALSSTFALAQTVSSDILLVTDGEISAIDSTIESAKGSGHRLFVVGIGSSPAETHLRRLAEATGGACDFVAPGEAVEPAVLRMFARLRSPRLADLSLEWPGGAVPEWVSPLLPSVFDGDTVNAFALFEQMPTGNVRLLGRCSVDEVPQEIGTAILPSQLEVADTLSRMAAAVHFHSAGNKLSIRQPADAIRLAVDYQLVTDKTNFLLVHARPDGEKATDMPELQKVDQMVPSGWGGTGSVMFSRKAAFFETRVVDYQTSGSLDWSDVDAPSVPAVFRTVREPSIKFCAMDDTTIPAFLRKRDQIIDHQDRRYWAESEHYSGLTPLGVSEWLRITPASEWPTTYMGLRQMGVGEWLVDWLELVMASHQGTLYLEPKVVEAFLYLMSRRDTYESLAKSEGLLGALKSTVLRLRGMFAVDPADRSVNIDVVLVEAMVAVLDGMTASAWPDRVFSMGGAVDEVRDAREPATIA